MSYHYGGDQTYYDKFSEEFHDIYEGIYDNSLECEIDSDDVGYVMRRIRENFITGISCTIVLVGEKTWGRKYVDWEIKATLDKQHGLIGARLPTAPASIDNKVTVPDRLHDNIESGYALWLSWAQITASAEQLARYIEQVNARNKKLIVNTRPRRVRNA